MVWIRENNGCKKGTKWFKGLPNDEYTLQEMLDVAKKESEVWHVFWCICRFLKPEKMRQWTVSAAKEVLGECELEFPEYSLAREMLESAERGLKPFKTELRPEFGYESQGISALQAAHMAYHSDEGNVIGEQSIRDAYKAVVKRKRRMWIRRICQKGIELTK